MGRGIKQHFIYKIYFLCGFPTGRYYLGKHTGYIDDSYGGSGNFCEAYYKKYGKIEGTTYIREILEINPSKKINADREEIIIDDLWKTDPLCMNQGPGGRGNEYSGKQKCHKVRQYDIKTGNLIKEWNSVSEAEQTLKINNISRACKHSKANIVGSWIWRYASENLDKVNPQNANPKHSRAVIQYDLHMNEIARFDKIIDAANKTGLRKNTIQECCIGRTKTGGGFIWKYVDNSYIRPCNRDLKVCGAKTVLQYDLDNNLINEYVSANEAERQTKINASTITMACRRENNHIAKNYVWKYKEE